MVYDILLELWLDKKQFNDWTRQLIGILSIIQQLNFLQIRWYASIG